MQEKLNGNVLEEDSGSSRAQLCHKVLRRGMCRGWLHADIVVDAISIDSARMSGMERLERWRNEGRSGSSRLQRGAPGRCSKEPATAAGSGDTVRESVPPPHRAQRTLDPRAPPAPVLASPRV